MNYPPYSDIISIALSADTDDEAMAYASTFCSRLKELRSAPDGAVIMKPRLDERRNDGRSRAVFLIKAPQGSRAGYVSEYMKFRDRMIENRAPAFIEIDVNPYGSI